jgi:hypothetical protein
MIRLSRDSWLGIALFLLLTLVTAVGVIQEAQEAVTQPPLASASDQPDGAHALWYFLDDLGYSVTNELAAAFTIPQATHLMLLLEPTAGISENEWEQIDAWVQDGGDLLIAGRGIYASLAMAHYQFRLDFGQPETDQIWSQTPLFISPPLADDTPLESRQTIESERGDFVTLMANVEGKPTAVSIPEGAGQVILISMAAPFTNEGLKRDGNAELILNLISGSQAKTIWFDEWHHGVRPQETGITANNWLRRTPIGRALLFVALVVFIAMLLQGRNFGRPVPLAKEITRRAPLEYISGIASLSRRAGHRTAVLKDYHDRLKRELGHRYRLDVTLPDNEFVSTLANYNPTLDAEALLNLLNRLSRSKTSKTIWSNMQLKLPIG